MTTTPKGLTFNARRHAYQIDGHPVPGVTTILGVVNKPALPKWSAKRVAEYVADNPDGVDELRRLGRAPLVKALQEIPWAERDLAAKRGTEVHAAAEAIIHGQEIDVPAELVGHVQAYIQFLDDYEIQPVLVEVAVGSRTHKYAGTLDMVADSNRHPRGIYDLKTARGGIYASTAYQNTAYTYADFYGLNGSEQSLAGLGVEASFGVHIRSDGYDVHPLEFGLDVFEEFLHIRATFDANRRAEGDWRTPGTGYVGLSEQQEEEIPW